ncbi:NAD(P)/FAD-dependent oxidoreductase [Haloparvum alkalitolerans]|uniref:NAD(P)/FAD-dependent oxidoreductase n=1 Tax=Haloparvum alkalitolerans TaxID=1042953 RepID=UPI003CF7F7E0
MRVVVLGGGYAGLVTTRTLEGTLPSAVDLTLVDETGDHLIQHELHRAIRRPEFVDRISLPLTDLLDRATVREATVASVDREDRSVRLADGDAVDYDVVVVALGAGTDYRDVPGVAEHALPLKRLPHASRIRREFRGVLDAGGGRAVVAGAGLSGVQTAGELAQFARDEGVAGHVEVVLLEAEDRVVPGFPEEFRAAVREELDRLDVAVRTGTRVTAAGADAVEMAGESVDSADAGTLPHGLLVWTGGVRGPDALDGRRREVDGTLALDERTFVVGDAARVRDGSGAVVPPSAQAAVRASETAANNVAEAVEALRAGREPAFETWTFETPGWLVSVGDGAVAQLGPRTFTGPTANLIKSAVGVTYLADHGSLADALAVLREEVEAERDLLDAVRERVGEE